MNVPYNISVAVNNAQCLLQEKYCKNVCFRRYYTMECLLQDKDQERLPSITGAMLHKCKIKISQLNVWSFHFVCKHTMYMRISLIITIDVWWSVQAAFNVSRKLLLSETTTSLRILKKWTNTKYNNFSNWTLCKICSIDDQMLNCDKARTECYICTITMY